MAATNLYGAVESLEEESLAILLKFFNENLTKSIIGKFHLLVHTHKKTVNIRVENIDIKKVTVRMYKELNWPCVITFLFM